MERRVNEESRVFKEKFNLHSLLSLLLNAFRPHPDSFSSFSFPDPPEIEVERSWIHSGEGYEAELACIVHSDPPASVSANWAVMNVL